MVIDTPKTLKETWEPGHHVVLRFESSPEGDNVVVDANVEGYLTLAKLMLYMASAQEHGHLHLDRYSGIDRSSNVGLVLTHVPRRDSSGLELCSRSSVGHIAHELAAMEQTIP